MANRNFPSSRVFGQHLLPVKLDLQVPIGSTGAVGTLAGQGVNSMIASVTRLAVGTYQIKLKDNYYAMVGMNTAIQSPVTGSAILIASSSVLTSGAVYQITTVGTSTTANWVAAGLPVGQTPAVGQIIVAAGTGGFTGTGAVKALGVSGIYSIELIGSGMLNPDPAAAPGALITIQCLGPTSSSVTTQIPVDPTSGSILFIELNLNNSSVQ